MLLGFLDSILSFLLVPWIFYTALVVLAFAGSFGLRLDGEETESSGLFWSFLASVFIVALVARHFEVTRQALHDNWLWYVVALALYFVVGLVWAFFKWYRFIQRTRKLFDEAVVAWLRLEKPSLDEVRNGDQELLRTFLNHMRDSMPKGSPWHWHSAKFTYSNVVQSLIPLVSNYKGLVSEWIALWPLSVLNALLRDALSELVSFLFDSVRRRFQAVADNAFKDV